MTRALSATILDALNEELQHARTVVTPRRSSPSRPRSSRRTITSPRTSAPAAGVEIENINGRIEVTRGAGRTADVTVTKTVKSGDGSMVKAISEETGNGLHVCTVYLNRDPNRRTCDGDNNDSGHRNNHLDVDMHYVVRIPAGVRLVVEQRERQRLGDRRRRRIQGRDGER